MSKNNTTAPADGNQDQSDDRLEAEVRAVVKELIQRGNEPEKYRECVRLGERKNLRRYGQCLIQEGKMSKGHASEIVCILRQPEIASDFVADKTTFREALTAARKVSTTHRNGGSHGVRKDPAARQKKQLEKALLKLAGLFQAAGPNGTYTIELQGYRLTYLPNPPSS